MISNDTGGNVTLALLTKLLARFSRIREVALLSLINSNKFIFIERANHAQVIEKHYDDTVVYLFTKEEVNLQINNHKSNHKASQFRVSQWQ